MNEYERKLSTINSADETDDAPAEDSPCLPNPQYGAKRKSLESLNKSRDLEDNNTSVLDVEKNKNTENANNYTVNNGGGAGVNNATKSKIAFKNVTFNGFPAPSKFEKWAQTKTGLSRSGLVIVICLVLLLFLLVVTIALMGALWPSIPHSMSAPICRRPSCLLASSEIQAKLNRSAPACQDIREFACGHWLSTHTIPRDKSQWGMKEQMRFKHRENLRTLIDTMPYPEDVENLQWRVKNMYESCMAVGSVETEEGRMLRKVIIQLGGWHVLKDFSVKTWEMEKTLMRLHSKYNIQPFFKVEVVPDAKEPLQSIIQISPGNLGLPDKSYYYQHSEDKVVRAYKTFLKDIALTFGATSDAANTFSDDIIGFEKRLAERFPSRVPERVPHYRPTIAKLEEIAPSVPLFDILSSMFPEAKLSKKSEVVVVAADHLVNVSRFFSTTDRSVMNDYMMLKLAVGYLEFLSKPFRNTLTEFNSKLYGTKEPKPRWEFCVETLQKIVGFGLEAMLEEKMSSEGERKRKVVADIFEQIRLTMKDAVAKSNNLPNHVQDHFLDKLKNIGIQVGLPVSMRHSTYYNDFYRSLTSIKHDFFQNVMYGVNFIAEEQQKRLTSPSEEHRWMDVVSDGNLNVVYIPEMNKVVVPMSLLNFPYFHPHYPASVLYGSIGVEIALAILGSMTGRGLFHSGDGIMLPSEHPLHNTTHDCLIHLNVATPYLEAIRFTLLALQNSLAPLQHSHIPALEFLEDEEVFFVSYAQSLCSMKTIERQAVDATNFKSNIDDLYLLQTIMEKSKPFSKTFKCDRPLRKDLCDTLI